MADNRHHDLFKQYPIAGRIRTSRGMLPSPYHVYDGKVTFVAGTASLEAVQQVLQSNHVHPIRTKKGRALMGMWICDFTDASLGPHLEFQFSFFVSEQELKPVSNHPLILLRELLLNPQIRMMVHGLWNTSETVVGYNSEVLGLDARLIRGGSDYKSGSMNFLFNDFSQGNLVASGRFSVAPFTPIPVSASLIQVLGLGGMMRFNSQPYITTQVMNRVNGNFQMNNTAQTYTAASKVVVQTFNPKKDKLVINQQPYGSLEFRPKFVEHMFGFKFVYLNPHNRVDVSL